MARWELTLHQQPPMLVECDDQRNLTSEWLAVRAKRRRGDRQHTWIISDRAAVDIRAVIGVLRHDRNKKRIGFSAS